MTRNSREINDLTEQLEELTIQYQEESRRLRQRIERLRASERNNETSRTNPYRVGDIVTITNNYQGNYGVTGVVVRVTRTRVTIEEHRDSEIYTHTRSFTNVRLYEE